MNYNINLEKLPRLRTINAALNELKTIDSDTAIKHSTIRKLIKDGVITSRRINSRYLIDMNELLKYLQMQNVEAV